MSYRDANGNEFESYAAACHYYGVPSPAEARAEDIEMFFINMEEFIGPLRPKDIESHARQKLAYTAACSSIRYERGQPTMPRCCDFEVLKPKPPSGWMSFEIGEDDDCPF